jgi:hypothetical protein
MKSYYLHYCRILRRVIGQAKNKSKTSWRIIRDKMGKSGTNNQTPTSFKNDNLIINPIQIAYAFNDCCINVVYNISNQSMSLLIML